MYPGSVCTNFRKLLGELYKFKFRSVKANVKGITQD